MHPILMVSAVVTLLLVSQPAVACLDPWPEIRDPVDVAQLEAEGVVTGDDAERLDALAGRRQGMAAKLLELRYAVGKTASTSDAGETELNQQILDLRSQVETTAQQLAFLDAEIARFLADLCERR